MGHPTRSVRAGGSLATDPSALETPENLRTADDVLMHRPGVIQPRPGFGDTTGIAARSTAYRPIAIRAFDGDLVVQSIDGANYRLEKGSANAVYTGDVTPFEVVVNPVAGFAESRESLYLTTSTGVKKLTGVAASALAFAGARTFYVPPLQFEQTSTTDRYAKLSNTAVAYKYAWRSTDANGYVRRSASSSRWVDAADLPKHWTLFDRIYLPSGIAAGDHFELYRTEAVSPETATPGTEYFLVVDYAVTSTDVSNGYITEWTIVDDKPDAMLGATLYTSPSQGGIGQANELPPCANAIAEWAGVMWYGNVQSRAVAPFEIVAVYDTANPDWDFVGLHYSSRTGEFSSGTDLLTSISGVDGMKVGQYVTDTTDTNGGPRVAGTHIPANTTLLTLNTRNLINNASLADGNTLTLFGGKKVYTWRTTATLSDEIQIGASSAASATNLVNEIDGVSYDTTVGVDLTLSATSGGGTTVVITETHGHGVEATVSGGGGQTISYDGTMSANATATGSGITFTARDFLVINGVTFWTAANQGGEFITTLSGRTPGGRRQLFGLDTTTSGAETNTDLAAEAADQLMHAVVSYAVITDTTWGVLCYRDTDFSAEDDSAFVLLRQTPDLGTFTVSCTIRPEAFRPSLQSTFTTESTRARHRLFWSKPQEPEAVPLLNFTDVGRRDADILALVPLETALLVFKEDGLFAVEGYAPNSWSVREVDRSLRLLAAQCVCVLGNACYAWTNHGVVTCTPHGTRPVSQPIGVTLRDIQRLLPLDEANHKRGFWMASHDRFGLVILGTGSSTTSTNSNAQYVFHTTTGRWAKWKLSARCLTYDPAEDRAVYSAAIDAWSVLYERIDEDAAATYVDASLAGLTASISGTSVTIATSAFGGHTPQIGDVVVDGSSVVRRVTAVQTSGSDKILTVTSSGMSGVTADWHQRIRSTLKWQAQTMPGQCMRWFEWHARWGSSDSQYISPWPAEFGGASSERGGSALSADVKLATDLGGESVVTRVGPPRDLLRVTELYPQIDIRTAGVWWVLSQFDLLAVAHQQSQRVAR
jgi:hypothetical protein